MRTFVLIFLCALCTFGCQRKQSEKEKMEMHLDKLGLQIDPNDPKGSVVIPKGTVSTDRYVWDEDGTLYVIHQEATEGNPNMEIEDEEGFTPGMRTANDHLRIICGGDDDDPIGSKRE